MGSAEAFDLDYRPLTLNDYPEGSITSIRSRDKLQIKIFEQHFGHIINECFEKNFPPKYLSFLYDIEVIILERDFPKTPENVAYNLGIALRTCNYNGYVGYFNRYLAVVDNTVQNFLQD